MFTLRYRKSRDNLSSSDVKLSSRVVSFLPLPMATRDSYVYTNGSVILTGLVRILDKIMDYQRTGTDGRIKSGGGTVVE